MNAKIKLLNYLKEIGSSLNTIKAIEEKISLNQSEEILKILDDFDLDDVTLFYMGKCPQSINLIKQDLDNFGEIQRTRYNSLINLSYQLGYCVG